MSDRESPQEDSDHSWRDTARSWGEVAWPLLICVGILAGFYWFIFCTKVGMVLFIVYAAVIGLGCCFIFVAMFMSSATELVQWAKRGVKSPFARVALIVAGLLGMLLLLLSLVGIWP